MRVGLICVEKSIENRIVERDFNFFATKHLVELPSGVLYLEEFDSFFVGQLSLEAGRRHKFVRLEFVRVNVGHILVTLGRLSDGAHFQAAAVRVSLELLLRANG